MSKITEKDLIEAIDFLFVEKDLIEAIDFLFVERQGHCPSELYEDGYSDACADAKIVIKRLFQITEE